MEGAFLTWGPPEDLRIAELSNNIRHVPMLNVRSDINSINDSIYDSIMSKSSITKKASPDLIGCKLCPESYEPGKAAYIDHMKKSHELGEFQCLLCGFNSNDNVRVKKHEQNMHSRNDVFKANNDANKGCLDKTVKGRYSDADTIICPRYEERITLKRPLSEKTKVANSSANKNHRVNYETKIGKAYAPNASKLSPSQFRPNLSSPKLYQTKPLEENNQSRTIEHVLPCFQEACVSCPAKTGQNETTSETQHVQSVRPEIETSDEIKEETIFSNQDTLKCGLCGLVCEGRDSLEIHTSIKHSEYVRDSVKSFIEKANLLRKIKTSFARTTTDIKVASHETTNNKLGETNLVEFLCSLCGFVCNQSSKLKTHQQNMHTRGQVAWAEKEAEIEAFGRKMLNRLEKKPVENENIPVKASMKSKTKPFETHVKSGNEPVKTTAKNEYEPIDVSLKSGNKPIKDPMKNENQTLDAPVYSGNIPEGATKESECIQVKINRYEPAPTDSKTVVSSPSSPCPVPRLVCPSPQCGEGFSRPHSYRAHVHSCRGFLTLADITYRDPGEGEDRIGE